MIGPKDHNGVFKFPAGSQLVQKQAHLGIDVTDTGRIGLQYLQLQVRIDRPLVRGIGEGSGAIPTRSLEGTGRTVGFGTGEIPTRWR